jgi:hypothetical protein
MTDPIVKAAVDLFLWGEATIRYPLQESDMETQIVNSSAALAALQKKLEELKGRAESLVVRGPDDVILAKNLKLDIGAYVKAVKFQTGPDIETKKEELRALQSQEKMLLAPAEQILEIEEGKRKAWENEERRKAEEEQRRINEENRIAAEKKAAEERAEREKIAKAEREAREKEIAKQRAAGEIKAREEAKLRKEAAEAEERERQRAAEDAKKAAESAPQVTVKPNIPTVQGVASRQNWKFRFVDPNRVPRPYMMPDEVKIGQMVRATKDKKAAEAMCPGIEVWSE